MFSGIVETLGTLTTITPHNEDVSFEIQAPGFNQTSLALGDSIAVNGVCLTVTSLTEQGFTTDLSKETLDCTNLGQLTKGSKINLEHALTLQTKVNGHLLSGHVDAKGQVEQITEEGRSTRFIIRYPAELDRYIAAKGSIGVDGVSLTVNWVKNNAFDINIIPHTLEKTTLQFLQVGDDVNLEVDLLARYLEKLAKH